MCTGPPLYEWVWDADTQGLILVRIDNKQPQYGDQAIEDCQIRLSKWGGPLPPCLPSSVVAADPNMSCSLGGAIGQG